MKFLILLSLATLACASVYKTPELKTIVVEHIEEDHYPSLPEVKSYPAVAAQSVSHPALLGLHYPVKKYTVHYPSGIYHGPHGVGVYDPKLHDELEEAYYRG